jgi:dTDP-4-amino-4,6-dideoxygalactose transaminase
MIPMVDLRQQYATLRGDIDAAIHEVLETTQFILGPQVGQFEQELANYLGVQHALTCASGTDALHLALRAVDLGPGDEIITTPFTFIATAEAIRYVGATPVFVDIDPRTFNINPEAVAAAITPRTRAILPVHLFGQPADLPQLQSIADDHHLILIEDCAQSFGADIAGQKTGSGTALGCFSFFPSKNLGGYGDGGLVTTNCEPLARRIRSLRNHGSEQRYHHDEIGYNSRLDELQAAILRVKLRHIDAWNESRRRVAALYDQLLSDVDVETPWTDGVGRHVYHQYTILTDQRERIAAALKDADIAHAVYYPIPLHRQKAFDSVDPPMPALPVSEDIARRCLSLPIYPELESAQVEFIAARIRAALS